MENPAHDLVTRASGLIVPADLATQPDVTRPDRVGFSYDDDGRRRIVLTRDDRRKLDKAARALIDAGLGIVIACHAGRPRLDGKEACGNFMEPEGNGTRDPGFGCRCTRIHFR